MTHLLKKVCLLRILLFLEQFVGATPGISRTEWSNVAMVIGFIFHTHPCGVVYCSGCPSSSNAHLPSSPTGNSLRQRHDFVKSAGGTAVFSV